MVVHHFLLEKVSAFVTAISLHGSLAGPLGRYDHPCRGRLRKIPVEGFFGKSSQGPWRCPVIGQLQEVLLVCWKEKGMAGLAGARRRCPPSQAGLCCVWGSTFVVHMV